MLRWGGPSLRSPPFHRYSGVRHRIRSIHSESSRSKAIVTRADIVAGLGAVGIKAGDVVFAHSSLSSFGQVVGGADAVIDAMLDAVGPTGTVAVPTFTWNHFHDKSGETFDVRQTPSEVGRITEVFRKRPQAIRSPHICHSVAAIGPHAAELTRETASPYLTDSTFDALVRLDAWNLFLGVDFGCCTAFHVVEEQMLVPYRSHRDYRDCTIVHTDGIARPCISTEFLRKPGFGNDFAKMGPLFKEKGVLRAATVGDAAVTNVRIRDVIGIARGFLERDVLFLLAR